MLENQGQTSSLTAIEARNALRADTFRGLANDIPLWRFRDVLIKLGTELGLSGGAVVYALDLIGLLTEADWRGDGRAITFHSLRAYARKVGKSERTISEYERQLIAAGLAHRTVKHARRHGGYGNEARRTGLDWRSFGVSMPELLIRLDQRAALEEHRLDLEARIRSTRHIVLGMLNDVVERRGEGAETFTNDYVALDVARLRGTLSVPELERRLAGLSILQIELQTVLHQTEARNSVDNKQIDSQTADQSEDSSCLIDNTDKSPCPMDIRSEQLLSFYHKKKTRCGTSCLRPDGLETKATSGKTRTRCQIAQSETKSLQEVDNKLDTITLQEIWQAAPESWKTALGNEVGISWPAFIEIAQHFAAQLCVSPFAWNQALRILGPSEAALALMILDRNRDHPLRPVMSVGGALVGMTRRAERGAFNIAPSVYGVIARPIADRGNALVDKRNSSGTRGEYADA